jgi:hypothetical protein
MNNMEMGQPNNEAPKIDVEKIVEAQIVAAAQGSSERRLWGNALQDYRAGHLEPLIARLEDSIEANENEELRELLSSLRPVEEKSATPSMEAVPVDPVAEEHERFRKSEEGMELNERVNDLCIDAESISTDVRNIFHENVGGDPYHFEELLNGGTDWTKEELLELERTIGDFIEAGKKMEATAASSEKDRLRLEVIEKAKDVSNVIWPQTK